MSPTCCTCNMECFRVEMSGFISEVRQQKGGSLSGASFEEIVQLVTELILHHQEKVVLKTHTS